ncbi:serine aminopeptidase domain-containing protein [Novosphingobium sp. BL-52-GroH]|uniref:alpha/beta hydrolase n=1 Tax=Novosphingobium sp. BL-52-GroH TaxID=3349877 RepID=UPI00384AC4B8
MKATRLFLGVAMAAALPVPAPAAPVQAPVLATTPGRDVRVEVVQLESDPPEKIKEAPGGGRTLAPAMLYTPASGANPFGPAIVMLDDGPGSHPLAKDQATRFAAEKLAAQGYTVLSLYTGQERNFPTVPFGDNKWAIASALAFLEHAGYEDFAIAAQGYGALVAADYLKSQPDKTLDNGSERRVKGLILVNPVLDVKGFPAFGDSKGYAERTVLARRELADGTGKYLTSLEPGHGTEGNQADWIRQGNFVSPAEAWLQYWSPEAQARNLALLKDLPVPVYVLAGDKAPTTPASAVPGISGTSTKFAAMAGVLDPAAVTDGIAGWLKAEGLGVRPKVRITTADVATDGGAPLFGMVYEPEGGADPAKPVVMLIHGRSGDTLQSSTHWMGWRFAQAGYKAIAPSLRISGATGIETGTMADVEKDIGHWVDATVAMGAKRVVLTGHSNGGIWISNYMSDTHDKRIAGMVYFAPTVDAAEFQKRLVGEKVYQADNARAYAAIAKGRGLDEVMGLNTAVSYSELYGSKARTVHSQRVGEFDLPGIAFAGGKDALMQDWFLDRFQKGYRGKLTLVRYPEGSHGFRESKDRLIADAAAWIARTLP